MRASHVGRGESMAFLGRREIYFGHHGLKFSARTANQTTRTLVTINAPKFPWSEDKFQIPPIRS